MKRLVRRIVALGALAAALGGLCFYGSRYLWPPQDRSTIHTVGMIEAPEVNITSRIAGRIAELSLLEGDNVKRGQVVCRIEDVDLRNQLRRAAADLERAKVDLSDAQLNDDRIQALFKQGVASTKQRDDATLRVGQARAAVASAQANLQFYRDQLRDTQIVSPISGVVVNKPLEVGEWVTPGTPILTVDDLSTIWARVDVQETDLGSLRVGEPAQVELPTNPPSLYSGRVMAIGQEGEFATEHDVRRGHQDIRTFYVKVRVLQADGMLKPGMTAEVSFSRRDGTRIIGDPR